MKAALILISLISAGISAYFGQPLVRDNAEAINTIVTVMTVFAGFLVAIIAILGDPAMTPKGSWRVAETRHQRIERMVIQHTYLFYIYLISIGFLFVAVLIRKEPDDIVSTSIKMWIERAYLFFGVFSFLLTLSLPRTLGKLQLERSEAEIEHRRNPKTPNEN